MSIPLSPAVRAAEDYPWTALDAPRQRAIDRGVDLIDFGIGDPLEETPAFIREAIAAQIRPTSSYPRAAGLPELREAIAGWAQRRFAVDLDVDRQIVPTLGSKEIIFALAGVLVDPDAGKNLVMATAPGYTVPERGAAFVGADVLRLPLREDNDFLPDFGAIDDATWDRTAIVWVNYPNNPTGATAPLSFYEELAGRARQHGFVVASDEAYCELYFDDEKPASILQLADLSHVVAVHTLSKRSSMTGYRSGFIAGDVDVMDALRRLRPSTGVNPQEFLQRASAVAWSDDQHVADLRDVYDRKRRVLLEVFAELGLRVAGSAATFYLWLQMPQGVASADFARRLLEDEGVVLAPGSFFGPEGEGSCRLAVVPTYDRCVEAAERIRRWMETTTWTT